MTIYSPQSPTDELKRREEASMPRDPWAVNLWEQLQDIQSNEQAWDILEEAKTRAVIPMTKLQAEAMDHAAKAIERLNTSLSDALGHLEGLQDFLMGDPDVLTEDAAAKLAEATEFLRKHGHGTHVDIPV